MTNETKANSMEQSFETYLKTRHCFNAVRLPYELRCNYVRTSDSCANYINFFSYIENVFCDWKVSTRVQELLAMLVLIILASQLLLMIAIVVDKFFAPSLKVIAKKMHMNEHLAGVTILAFGSNASDLFSNLSIIFNNDLPIFANLLSSSLFVTMVSGGLICYTSPFKLSPHATIRDILFFFLGTLLLDYFILNDNIIDLFECFYLLLSYIVYIGVIVFDMVLLNRTIRNLEQLLTFMRAKPSRRRDYAAEKALEEEILHLKVEAGLDIKSNKIKYTGEDNMLSSMERNTSNSNETKIAYYQPGSAKNRNLFWDFFKAINPIDSVDWALSSYFIRGFMILKSPVVFLANLYIPRVNIEENKHGWTKLLNCIQIVLNPSLSAMIALSFFSRRGQLAWYKKMNPMCILYPMPITVPVAIFVFIYSRTDLPPPYHFAFTLMAAYSSIFVIFICCSEFEQILNLAGTILEFSDGFMGATISAFASSIGDLVINVQLALQGYERMAFAASYGGPFFNIVFSTSIIFSLNCVWSHQQTFTIEHGEYGMTSFVFIMLGLSTTLLWTLFLNFHSRRSIGIYNLVFYGIFLLMAILIEYEVIHSWKADNFLPIV